VGEAPAGPAATLAAGGAASASAAADRGLVKLLAMTVCDEPVCTTNEALCIASSCCPPEAPTTPPRR
jgi:hypothetical protein